MTTIGLIGSGNVGSSVARLGVNAGHDVVLSNSRGPETLRGLVDQLGAQARAATADEVIDTCNYYPQRDGHVAELDDESTTSSELVQRHLRGSKVVKCFNNLSSVHLRELARPTGSPDRSVLAIAGDDANAKAVVSAFLDSIGYDAYDAGALSEGWRFQRDTAAYAGLYNGDTSGTWPPPPGSGVRITADAMRAKLAEARRYRDM
jgi:predicted dinucleotide-binding enzyme